MKRALFLLAALFLGVFAGEFLTTNLPFRIWIGRLVRRGELQALVERRGIYRDPRRSLQSQIDDAKLTMAAGGERVDEAARAREMQLLRAQLPNDKTWETLLQKSGWSAQSLRDAVASQLRGLACLETKLSLEKPPSETELQRFYETYRDRFQEPLRLRASHLFLAAPEGYPAEVIGTKQKLIMALGQRLKNGEPFAALVAQYSEDEATRLRGGDLNWFAQARMLPAVWQAAQRLRAGETSAPLRSRLGFHILRLTNRLPPEIVPFPEAASEIALALENERRAATVARLVGQLPGKIEFAAPPK